MEIVKMNVLNVTARLGESESLTKHISCDCKCRFDSKKCQEWNKELCRCQCKKSSERLLCEKEYVWNPSTCACKIDKYQKSITGNSVVICDEIIKPARWENFRILNYCGLLKMVELII